MISPSHVCTFTLSLNYMSVLFILIRQNCMSTWHLHVLMSCLSLLITVDDYWLALIGWRCLQWGSSHHNDSVMDRLTWIQIVSELPPAVRTLINVAQVGMRYVCVCLQVHIWDCTGVCTDGTAHPEENARDHWLAKWRGRWHFLTRCGHVNNRIMNNWSNG